jgi:hypothetical protein
MRRLISLVAVSALALTLGGGLTACKEQGPMEKAGEAVDNAVEDMKDVGQGTMEKAGEDADEAIEKAKEAVEK